MRALRTLELAALAAGASARALGRRARRGPTRPGWSLRTELAARVTRAVVLRSRRRGIHWLREAQALLPASRRLAAQVRSETLSLGGVPTLAVVPRDEAAPPRTLVHLHGGGYVIGSPESYRDTLARLALGARARVLGVAYRKAPEHLFPAAQEDALAATRAALAETPSARLALVGDSAGGALCVATLCALRDAGEPLPAAAALLCPWVDPLASGGSMAANADADFADREVLVHWIRTAAGAADPADPRLTVLAADLRGLPPLLVQAGGAEILLDSIRAFAERASAAGVEVELRVWDDLFHDFQMSAEQLPEGAAALEEVAGFLRKRLGA